MSMLWSMVSMVHLWIWKKQWLILMLLAHRATIWAAGNKIMLRNYVSFVRIKLNTDLSREGMDIGPLESAIRFFSFMRSFNRIDIWNKWSKYCMCRGFLAVVFGWRRKSFSFSLEVYVHVKALHKKETKGICVYVENYRTGPIVPHLHV